MKSICIKTNDIHLLNYLLNEFDYIEIDKVCISTNQFKNYKNIIIVKGNEETTENISKRKYWQTIDGKITEYIIDPEYFGINYKKSMHIILPEESLNMTRNPSDELEKLAKLNAAMFLIAAQKADDIKTAFEMIE